MSYSSSIGRFERGDPQGVPFLSIFRASRWHKMYRDLRLQYYWSGMKKHVGDFIQKCLTCQQIKAKHQRPVGLLQPLEVAEWKWEHIRMDFVTHFPQTSQKHDVMWVIVD